MSVLPDAVILDFGGVLYDIDYDAPVCAFNALGVNDFAGLYKQSGQSPEFDDLECGRIAPEVFYRFMATHCAPGTSRQEIVDAWNSILIGMHPSRIKLVQALGRQTRLYIFSNTNVIHAQAFESWVEHAFGLSAFRSAFEGIHYSHELGMRKPEPAAFLHLCKGHGIAPDRALFIDDSEQHIRGASRAGLETHWHYSAGEDIAIWLANRGFEIPSEAFRD